MGSRELLASTAIAALVPVALVYTNIIWEMPRANKGANTTRAIIMTIFNIDGGAFCRKNVVIAVSVILG